MRILLNPSGIPHANGLVALRARYLALADLNNIGISAPDFGDAADGKDIFQSAAALQVSNFNLSRDNANPILLTAAKVSFRLFRCLPGAARSGPGVHCGRGPARRGARSGPRLPHLERPVRFRSQHRRASTLTLNQQPYRVIGVMGPEFNWPNQAEIVDVRSLCLPAAITIRITATTKTWAALRAFVPA